MTTRKQPRQKICDYSFSGIEKGLKKSFTKTITEQDMENFFKITGDSNPLHSDENYAKSKNHKGCVVFGMLTASLLSTLAGVYLPGLHSLIVTVKINFRKAVYVGDILTIIGEVIDKSPSTKFIKVNFSIGNQREETMSNGEMLIKVTD